MPESQNAEAIRAQEQHLQLAAGEREFYLISPSGMSKERADYLYKEIREFCKDGTEDLVAPPVPQ